MVWLPLKKKTQLMVEKGSILSLLKNNLMADAAKRGLKLSSQMQLCKL